MRRVAAFLVACLLLIGGTAMAAELTTQVGISDAGLTIKVPGDWYVLTRKSDVSEGKLADLGLTQSQWEQIYSSQDIYMDCMFSDFSGEFVLMMQETAATKQLYDLNECTEEMIKTIESVDNMDLEDLQNFDDSGNLDNVDDMNTQFGERYQHPQALFLTMDGNFSQQGSSAYFTAYTTILNGKQYNLYYRSYMGEITQQQRDEMRAIVESIEFSQVLPKPTKAPSASSAGKTESAISGVVNTAKDSGALRNLIIGVLIGLAVLVVALIIIIVIAVSVSHKRAKKKAAQQQMPFSGQPYTGATPYQPPVQPMNPAQPPVQPNAPYQPTVQPMNPAQPPVQPMNPAQPPVQPNAPEQPGQTPEHGPDDRPEG